MSQHSPECNQSGKAFDQGVIQPMVASVFDEGWFDPEFIRPTTRRIRCTRQQIDVANLPITETKVRQYGILLSNADSIDMNGPYAMPEQTTSDSVSAMPSHSGAPKGGASLDRATARARNLDHVDESVRRFTHIEPPRDVLKLAERLSYRLQPPLEYVLNADLLGLPFRPFDYQLDGVAFLFVRQEAILADEMGLGKTMQSALALRLLMHRGIVRRALLACPKPLINNWQKELADWAPDVPVTVLEGNEQRRRWLWRHATNGLMLANYELLVRDAEEAAAADPRFDLVVLDEAQRIKNSTSATSRVIRSLPRARSWALTGTPIENCADDLAGIFQFVAPGRILPDMRLSALRTVVGDYVLRRTKEEVLADLPPRITRDALLHLSAEQQAAYERAEEEGIVYLKELGDHVAVQHVFQLVTRLKQICNFDPETGVSMKMDRLRADLEECAASGRKAIVFSQWVGAIEQVAARLTPLNPLQYHGRVTHKERARVIQRFRDDESTKVLLMSYGAGGVGLNLQFASYVFLFDRWWNPAVEDQAINRAHRIGVDGPVTVTRFLSVGTIEERIDALLNEKRARFDEVFDASATPVAGGISRAEVLGLFGVAA